jgi:hypothetical protein
VVSFHREKNPSSADTTTARSSTITTRQLRVDRQAERSAVGLDEAVNEAARHELVAVAAYYRAERRGFAPGSELDDWLAAEAEFNSAPAEPHRE